MTDEKPRTHLLVCWRFQTPDDSAPLRAAADDTGRLIAFAELECAEIFAGRLRDYGLDAEPYPVTSPMVAELLHANDSHLKDDVIVFEAQTTGPGDAVRWAHELADRLIAKLAAAYESKEPGG